MITTKEWDRIFGGIYMIILDCSLAVGMPAKGHFDTIKGKSSCDMATKIFDAQRRLTGIFLDRINMIDMILRHGRLAKEMDVGRLEYLMNITKGRDRILDRKSVV